MTVSAKMDLSGWKAGLAKLDGPLRESLARSMAVAGGKVLRDEAKHQVPVDTGLLRESIYLAFKDGKSNDAQVVYSVTWNSKKAPHGHLIEFGHWHVEGGKGGTRTKWTPGKAFLRSAFDVAKDAAMQAMLERGRQRLPELLAGNNDGA